jgi:hypothetical protein
MFRLPVEVGLEVAWKMKSASRHGRTPSIGMKMRRRVLRQVRSWLSCEMVGRMSNMVERASGSEYLDGQQPYVEDSHRRSKILLVQIRIVSRINSS